MSVLAALLLAACDRTPDGQLVSYPRLSTVPERPQLQFSAADRRAMEEGLVADREDAVAQGDELAVRLGQREPPPQAAPTPPPPAPLPPPADSNANAGTVAAVAPPAEPAGVPVPFPGGSSPSAFGADSPILAGPPQSPEEVSAEGELAAAYVRDQIKRSSDEGKLKDFLGRIGRAPPRWVGPSSLAAAVGLQTDSQNPPPADGEPPAADAAASAPAAPASQGFVRVVFAPGAAGLAPATDAELRRALAAASDGRLRIVAAGADPGLGRERADAIAAALIRLGAAPAALVVSTSPDAGDAAVVYPIGATTS